MRFPIRVFRGGWESGQCEAISFVALQTCYILSFNLYIRFICFPYLSGHFGDRISTGLLSVPVVRRLLPINLSKYIYLCLSICLFSLFLIFFSHFNTYSLCSLSQNSPYLVTSHQILSFSFSFYSPIRSLLFVCRARLDKSAPLCHDSILERTKRHQILFSLVSLRYFDATSQDIRVSTTVYILRWLPLTLSLTFHIIYKYMSSYLLLYTCVHLHVQASILFLASSVPFILFYNLTL